MPKSTFNHWLTQARVTDDPVGDFVYDARRNPKFPPLVRSASHLARHLQLVHACEEAIATVPEVWERYEHWKGRKFLEENRIGGGASRSLQSRSR
jgi:uncharacterized protein YozE (UPF0346 family)